MVKITQEFLQAYPNLLDLFKFNYSEIEGQIREFKLSFSNIRDEETENRKGFPMFVPSFYRFIRENGRIPAQEEFWMQYLKDNSNWFDEKKLTEYKTAALKARVFRTYPSLVRDIHFALLIKEHGKFDLVFYNEQLDIEQGIDLIVLINDEFFGINLYADTDRAKEYRGKKQHRHEKLENIKVLDLPKTLFKTKRCGDFYLYSTGALEKLEEKIANAQI